LTGSVLNITALIRLNTAVLAPIPSASVSTATAVKATTSKSGNDYTTFQVKDASGSAVRVFSWGLPK
jgi:hypothetical protein